MLLIHGDPLHAKSHSLWAVCVGSDVSAIDDPCPFPHTEKRRRLNQKDKLLHAPMANLGDLTCATGVITAARAAFSSLQRLPAGSGAGVPTPTGMTLMLCT